MAFSSAALRTELQTDPTGLGYAPLITNGDDADLAALLNAVRGTITVFRNDIESGEIVGSTVLSDFTTLTSSQQNYYLAIVSQPTVDATNTNLRTSLATLFPAGSTTRTNLQALAQRNGSRAEQLFGTGISVSTADVARALGRG